MQMTEAHDQMPDDTFTRAQDAAADMVHRTALVARLHRIRVDSDESDRSTLLRAADSVAAGGSGWRDCAVMLALDTSPRTRLAALEALARCGAFDFFTGDHG